MKRIISCSLHGYAVTVSGSPCLKFMAVFLSQEEVTILSRNQVQRKTGPEIWTGPPLDTVDLEQ